MLVGKDEDDVGPALVRPAWRGRGLLGPPRRVCDKMAWTGGAHHAGGHGPGARGLQEFPAVQLATHKWSPMIPPVSTVTAPSVLGGFRRFRPFHSPRSTRRKTEAENKENYIRPLFPFFPNQ